jgi:SPP1 gp7 family putative phage head morphogenesis protein
MGRLAIVREKGMFGITWGTPGAETWDFAQEWMRGGSVTSSSVEKPYAQHSTLANALSIFVGDAASVGWELYEDGNNDDPVESHALLDLLANPSPMFSDYQFWVGTYLSRRLFGAWAWYYPDVHLGGRGGLKATLGSTGQILLLDPRALRRREGKWKLRVFGEEVTLDERHLTIGMRPDPYNPGMWLSEIDAVIIEIEGDYAAAQYNRSFFRDQYGMPSGLLVPHADEKNGPPERDAFVKRFNEDASRRRRSVGAVPPGWSWQDIGVAMKDMDFRNLREYSRELILAAVGVPPFMAGVLDKANYANAREQREYYWLGPQTRFLTEIQSVLNSDFLPKLGVTEFKLFPCWEKVKALIENLGDKITIAEKMFAMGVPLRKINDRLELGLDIDDLESADIGFLPFNLVPVSQVLNPPEPTAAPMDESEGDDGAAPAAPKRLHGHVRKDEARRATQWRSIVARARDLESRFDKTLRKHMQSIEEEVLANVNGIRGWKAVQTKDAGDLLFDKQRAQATLILQTAPLHRAGILRGADSIMSLVESEVDFSIGNPRVEAKLAELSHKITRIDNTIEAALQRELSAGVAEGESVAQLAARVRSVMDASKARSMTIARTETGFAFNTGRNEAMKQAGVERHEWLTARDGRVRDSHAGVAPNGEPVDGQRVAIGEPFTMASGATLLYPLDPSGPPGEIINCRCVAVPVLGE